MKRQYDLHNLRLVLKLQCERLNYLSSKRLSEMDDGTVESLRAISSRINAATELNEDEKTFAAIAMTSIDYLIKLLVARWW